MKNEKGYTLVELLVTILILGIITGMSMPVLSAFQNNNSNRKFTSYGETLISAAKLYVDAYGDDLFVKTDEDGCTYITYNDLYSRKMIRNIDIKNTTCNSENTFVKVVKHNDKYKYTYYLGCGNGSSTSKITSAKVDIIIPSNRSPYTMNRYACNSSNDKEPPEITYSNVVSTNTQYHDYKVNVSVNVRDNVTTANFKECLTESKDECTTADDSKFLDYVNTKEFTFTGSTYAGEEKKLYIAIMDEAGNIKRQEVSYNIYKKCTEVTNKMENSRGQCNKLCGTGWQDVNYYAKDKYFPGNANQCRITEKAPCNTQACCSRTKLQSTTYGDYSACSSKCLNGTKKREKRYTYVSYYDNSFCYTTVSDETASCNRDIPCTPFIVESPEEYTITSCTSMDKYYDGNRICRVKIPEGQSGTVYISVKIPSGSSGEYFDNIDSATGKYQHKWRTAAGKESSGYLTIIREYS